MCAITGGDANIRDVEIAALKSIEAKGYYVDGRFLQTITPGDHVIIKHGLFKGLNGSVKSVSGEHIYHISIESIGYSLIVRVPLEIIEKK